MSEGAYDGQVTRHCQFPDCDWSTDLYTENGSVVDDWPVVRHYENEHAGRVRVRVTVEYEQLLGGRSTEQVREDAIERYEERGDTVAYVQTKVLEESDDHSKLKDDA